MKNRGILLSNTLLSPCGAAFLELILIVPILVALLYGCLELSNLLRVQQILSTVSNESANNAFRVCSPIPDPQSCINQLRTDIVSVMAPDLPGLDLIISVYKYFPPGPNPVTQPASVGLVRISGVSTVTGLSAGGRRSKFTPPDVSGVVNLYRQVPLASFPTQVISSTNSIIAMSELFYTYQPIGLSTQFLARFTSRTFYESTIY